MTVVGEAGTAARRCIGSRPCNPTWPCWMCDSPMAPVSTCAATSAVVVSRTPMPDAHLVRRRRRTVRRRHGRSLRLLMKQVKGSSLTDAIQEIAAGGSLIDRSLTERLLQRLREPTPGRQVSTAAGDDLTPREQEILMLITDGMTNRQIGEQLFLAEKTVKHYVSGLLSKLGMQRRTQIAVYGSRLTSSTKDHQTLTVPALGGPHAGAPRLRAACSGAPNVVHPVQPLCRRGPAAGLVVQEGAGAVAAAWRGAPGSPDRSVDHRCRRRRPVVTISMMMCRDDTDTDMSPGRRRRASPRWSDPRAGPPRRHPAPPGRSNVSTGSGEGEFRHETQCRLDLGDQSVRTRRGVAADRARVSSCSPKMLVRICRMVSSMSPTAACSLADTSGSSLRIAAACTLRPVAKSAG